MDTTGYRDSAGCPNPKFVMNRRRVLGISETAESYLDYILWMAGAKPGPEPQIRLTKEGAELLAKKKHVAKGTKALMEASNLPDKGAEDPNLCDDDNDGDSVQPSRGSVPDPGFLFRQFKADYFAKTGKRFRMDAVTAEEDNGEPAAKRRRGNPGV